MIDLDGNGELLVKIIDHQSKLIKIFPNILLIQLDPLFTWLQK